MNYIGLKDSDKDTYLFRNGLKIKTHQAIDVATIAVVVIKKDYGMVKDNSVIIDIGANIGTYSLYATSTSKNTKVYAYEPMEETYKVLKENIRMNKLEKNIIPSQTGVSSRCEKRRLFLGRKSPFHSVYKTKGKENYIEIRCISLKDIISKNKIKECDILKMDCEGAEFEILYSVPEKYLKKIKEIRMEYHNIPKIKKYNIKSLIQFLNKKGYNLTRIKKDKEHCGDAWFERIGG